MRNVAVTDKPQLSVGLKFTFMGVDLSAFYQKLSNGYEIFLAPTNVENDVQLSISEIISQFNQLSGAGLSETDIENKITGDVQAVTDDGVTPVGIDWNSVKFCLKMLYLNIKSESAPEYALSLQIIADELIPKDIKIFNVDSLSFNIWNTQREEVLSKMALIDSSAY